MCCRLYCRWNCGAGVSLHVPTLLLITYPSRFGSNYVPVKKFETGMYYLFSFTLEVPLVFLFCNILSQVMVRRLILQCVILRPGRITIRTHYQACFSNGFYVLLFGLLVS